MICAHVPQTIPDCLRVKYRRADAQCALARTKARPSCARMPPVDACARDLRACAPDYPRLPARQVSTRIYARRTLARMNARPSCARIVYHDSMEVA